MGWKPLNIPTIRALDLRWADKYMAPSWFDPEDGYRAEWRLERRRRAAGFTPRTNNEVMHRAALHEPRFAHGDNTLKLRSP